ncbi:MAG: UbiA family prenyltransferase [Planctomycetota bacterium]
MRPYLQLLRAPLAATAVSNAWIGGALAGAEAPLGAWVALALASVALYWAGMALNDVFDRERDAHLYPKRPLPSGAIPVATAAWLGGGLLAGGVLLAAAAGAIAGRPLAGALGGLAVAGCVLAYDGLLKRWRHPGCLSMAACRVANAGLGVVVLGGELGSTWGWAYALALGVYVYGVTVISTYEDEEAPTASLVAVGLLLGALPAGLGVYALQVGGASAPPRGWAALGCGLLLGVLWSQLVDLCVHGSRARGQAAVRTLLHGLWAFDLGAGLFAAPWALFAPLGALYLASRVATKALFRPPPAPAQE